MATDVKKTVEIELKLTGDLGKAIDSLLGNFKELAKSANEIQNSIKPLIDTISKAKVPSSFVAAIGSLKSLDGVKIPSVTALVNGLQKLSGIGVNPNLETLFSSIEKFKGSSASGISEFANSLGKLASKSANAVSSAEGITKLSTALNKISKIKFPEMSQITANIDNLFKLGSKKFDASSLSALSTLAGKLKEFDKIKIPNINSFYKGLEGLKGFSDPTGKLAINLVSISSGLRLISGIKLPSTTAFVSGLLKLQSLDISAAVAKLFQLSKAIERLDKTGKLQVFATFASDINKLTGQLDSVFPKLDKTSTALRKAGEAAEVSGKSTKGFAERLTNYVQYRAIADSIFAVQNAFLQGGTAIKEYDQSLKDLQAISNASNAETLMMGDTLISVAKITKFSATEVAEGMKILAQAGFTAAEVTQSIGPIAELATGTLSDMGTTIDLVSTVLRVFDISAANTTHVVDALAVSINQSKLDVDKLRTAFNYVGPVAADAGVSFEEVSAAMMALANSGQRASSIGTGLRRLFSDLADPPVKLAAAVEKAGYSIDELNPSTNGLASVLSKLELIVTDTGQAFDIFGRYGANVVLTLKDSKNGFQEMLDSVGQSGEASRMAATQAEGLGVMVKNLSDRAGIAAIAVGNAGLTSVLKGFVVVARAAIEVFTIFAGSTIGKFVASAAVGVVAATGLLVIVGKLVTGIRALSIAYAVNTVGSFSMISNGKQVSQTLLQTGAALQTVVSSFGNAARGAVSFVGSLSTVGLVAGGFVAILAALGAGMAYVIGTMDRYKESSEKAFKDASELSTMQQKLQSYGESLVGVTEGSEEYKNANIALRKELLDAAKGNFALSESATAAASSIDPLTGVIVAGSKAIEEYQTQLNKATLDKFVESYIDAMKNVQIHTDGASRAWGNLKGAMSQMGQGMSGKFKALFNDGSLSEELEKAESKLSKFSLSRGLAERTAKDLQSGKKSWGDYAKYVAGVMQEGLADASPEAKDMVASFKLSTDAATALFQHLQKIDKVDVTGTSEQFVEMANGLGISGELLQALTYKFDKFQESAKRHEGLGVGPELVKEFADGTGSIEEFIGKYKQLGGILSKTGEQNIKSIEEERKALAAQFTTIQENYKLRLKGGAATQEDVEWRIRAEKEWMEAVRKVNKEGADDFEYNSVRKTALLEKELATEIDKIKAQKFAKEVEWEKIAEARITSEKKTQALLVQASSVGDVKDRYQTDVKAAQLAGEQKLHQIALLEAKDTEEHAKYEQQRYNVTLERYNKELQLAQEQAVKIALASDVNDSDKSDAEQKVLQVQKERTEFMKKELVDQLKAQTKANKELEDLNYKSTKENEKNLSKQGEDYDKYTDSIRDTRLKLQEKLDDIEYKRVEKLKKIADDILNIEKKTAASIGALNSEADDSIRSISQRGKSKRAIDSENKNVAYSKINEGALLVETAGEDAAQLERGKQLIAQGKSIGENLTSQSDAIDLVRRSTEELVAAEEASGRLQQGEKLKEQAQAEADSEQQRSAAIDASNRKKNEALDTYQEAQNAETTRHENEVQNLDKEIAKWNEKIAVLKEMISLSQQVAEPSFSQSPLAPTSQTQSGSPEQGTGKITTADGRIITYTADTSQVQSSIASMDEKSKAVGTGFSQAMEKGASDSSSSMEQGFRKIEENGKTIYTNLTDEQREANRAMAESSKSSSKEAFGQVEQDGVYAYSSVVDEAGKLKTLMTDGSTVTIENGLAISELQSVGEESKILADSIEAPIIPIVNTEDAEGKFANLEQSRKDALMEDTAPEPIQVPIDTTSIDEAGAALDEMGTTAVNVPISITDDPIPIASELLKEISETEYSVNLNTDSSSESIDEILTKLETIENKEITIDVYVTDLHDLNTLLDTVLKVEEHSQLMVKTTTEGTDTVAALKTLVDGLVDKIISVVANVSGMDDLYQLKTVIDSIQDKTVTITTRYQSEGTPGTVQASTGGLIGSLVQKFANGGEVFKKLKNRLISTGSGTKDDVPAMLMKDEFVHKSAAVKKYGVRFMNMINNLELPIQAVSKFANGGLVSGISDTMVQLFSKGGSVLGRGKKKIDEIFGIENTTNVSVDSLNVNAEITKAADKITTPLGLNALSQMADGFKNSVAHLASGGALSGALSSSELAKITGDYDKQISSATTQGNTDMAAVLRKEKLDIAALADELRKTLIALKAKYNQDVKDKKQEIADKDSEREESYYETKASDERDYSEQVSDDNRGYSRTDFDFSKEEKSKFDDLTEQLKTLEEELPGSLEEYSINLESKKAELEELAKNMADFRDKFPSAKYPKYFSVNGKVAGSALDGTLLKNDFGKVPFKDLAKEFYTSTLMGSLKASRMGEKTSYTDGGSYFNKAGYEAALSKYSKEYEIPYNTAKKEYESLSKENPTAVYEKAVIDLKDEYTTAKEATDFQKAREMEDRALSIFRRDRSYTEKRDASDEAFKLANEDSKLGLAESLANLKKTYEEDVAKAKTDNTDKIASVKEQALKDVESAKKNLSDTLESAKKTTPAASPAQTSTDREVIQSATSQFGMSIQELIKRLGRGILKFNTGGLVPMIQGAISGKDSVLAALTPREFVMNEGAVGAFGSGFFNMLNSIGVNGYNMGGAVSSAGPSLSESVDKVVHAVDLTFNGRGVGELQGNQMSIENFIQVLEMAKMRT